MTTASIRDVFDLLPKSMQEMAAQIGIEGVLVLVDKFGGDTLRIPSRKGSNECALEKRLAVALGCPQLISRLVHFYDNEVLYIPMCRAARNALRIAEIHRETESEIRKGTSMNEIVRTLAKRYDISTRWVWQSLKRLP